MRVLPLPWRRREVAAAAIVGRRPAVAVAILPAVGAVAARAACAVGAAAGRPSPPLILVPSSRLRGGVGPAAALGRLLAAGCRGCQGRELPQAQRTRLLPGRWARGPCWPAVCPAGLLYKRGGRAGAGRIGGAVRICGRRLASGAAAAPAASTGGAGQRLVCSIFLRHTQHTSSLVCSSSARKARPAVAAAWHASAGPHLLQRWQVDGPGYSKLGAGLGPLQQ